jgi:hypothetical protein
MRTALLAVLLVGHLVSWRPQTDATEQTIYRMIPDLDLRIFACDNPSYRVFLSRAELIGVVDRLGQTSPCAQLKESFLQSLARTSIRWEEEALLILEDWYGTGMAKAHLELTVATPRVVNATIVGKVPPPPVTPDTAVFRFAFVVSRSAADTVIVSGRVAERAVIPISRP